MEVSAVTHHSGDPASKHPVELVNVPNDPFSCFRLNGAVDVEIQKLLHLLDEGIELVARAWPDVGDFRHHTIGSRVLQSHASSDTLHSHLDLLPPDRHLMLPPHGPKG